MEVFQFTTERLASDLDNPEAELNSNVELVTSIFRVLDQKTFTWCTLKLMAMALFLPSLFERWNYRQRLMFYQEAEARDLVQQSGPVCQLLYWFFALRSNEEENFVKRHKHEILSRVGVFSPVAVEKVGRNRCVLTLPPSRHKQMLSPCRRRHTVVPKRVSWSRDSDQGPGSWLNHPDCEEENLY